MSLKLTAEVMALSSTSSLLVSIAMPTACVYCLSWKHLSNIWFTTASSLKIVSMALFTSTSLSKAIIAFIPALIFQSLIVDLVCLSIFNFGTVEFDIFLTLLTLWTGLCYHRWCWLFNIHIWWAFISTLFFYRSVLMANTIVHYI